MVSIATGEFQQPLDIANRACQHIGSRQITSFQQDSKPAQEINACYDKLRQSELRRNVWTFSIRKCVMRPINQNFGLVVPATWNAAATYLLGSLVQWNGVIYQARQAVPANYAPDLNPSLWQQAFISLAAGPWSLQQSPNSPQPWSSLTNYAAGSYAVGSDNNNYISLTNGNLNNNPVTDGGVHWQFLGIGATGSGYFAGEVVYTQASGQAPKVYVSLANNNQDIPGNLPAYSSTQLYMTGDTVTYSSVTYQSTTDFNVGTTPTGSAPWIAIPGTQADQMGGLNWLLLGQATLSALNIVYPLGAGPSSQVATRNVFKLPNGFLREAPQDPKAGSTNYLGAPASLGYRDWTLENGYLTSREVDAMTFRFAADIRDVTAMDPMFCELLAARIALEVCEPVTQSAEKMQTIGSMYQRFGGDARLVNGIETGSTEPEQDDYITCRL